MFEPRNLVMLASERIQEALDEAVERGRLTRGDANDLVGELLRRGRQQTEDVMRDLPQLIGKGIEQLDALQRRTSRTRRPDAVDRLMQSADRARRAVGVGPSFPILGYDDLSASQITERLADLSPAELRRVRDYESSHAARRSILTAIDRAIG